MSNTHAISLKRSTALLAALTFMAMLTVVNFASFFGTASAAQLASRSLTLSSTMPGGHAGDSVPGSETNGAEASHTFRFTAANTAASFTVTYCTNAVGTCVPASVDLTNATTTDGSFADSATNAGTWTVAVVVGANEFTLDDVVNPTAVGTFFVRIATAGGDDGTVASAITEGIDITARVAETLGFSTTGSFAGVGAPGSNCAPVSGSGAISIGDPTEQALSISTTFENYSVFRIYTNAASGVNVTYEGATLTKGPDNIDAIGGAAAAVNVAGGTEQFGLAVNGAAQSATLAINSLSGTVDASNVNVTGDFGTNPGELNIAAAYAGGAGDITTGTPGFAFVADTPTIIASSTNYVECVTVPVRYIANITPMTAAGTYTTTIVYSAVPTY